MTGDPDNGTYSRRRIDELMDDRFERIEATQDRTNRKIDQLSTRVSYIAGGLAVLSIIVNIVVPILFRGFTP